MNSSVNRIVDMLKQSKTIQDNHGCILTIDKSQGIDKDIIVLLIERGNEELVQNPRRLNVALTRAKSKLIIIGSDEHLSKMKVWEGTLGKMLKEYQIELSKAMIEEMMNALERPN
jgi:superfamily I DNA and/or RNA helicase